MVVVLLLLLLLVVLLLLLLLLLLKYCFTSTKTVGLLGTGAQDGHLDFKAEVLCAALYID